MTSQAGRIDGFRVFLHSVEFESQEVDLSQLRLRTAETLDTRVQQISNPNPKEELFRGPRVCLDDVLTFNTIDPKQVKAHLEHLKKVVSLFSWVGFGSMAGAVVAAGRAYVHRAALTQMSRYFHVAATVAALVISYFALRRSNSLKEAEVQYKEDTSLSLAQFANIRTRVLQQTPVDNPFMMDPNVVTLCVTDKEAAALFKERLQAWVDHFDALWPWASNPNDASEKDPTTQNAAVEFLEKNFAPLERTVIQFYHNSLETYQYEKAMNAFRQCVQSHAKDKNHLVFLNNVTEILQRAFPEAFNVRAS